MRGEKSYTVKKTITYLSILLSTLFGQFDLYPVTDFFGGGIGYSPMYINIDKLPATSLLKDVGLDPSEFNNPFVVHAGEGFAHMTGKWRIGGYAGVGSSSISTMTKIKFYVDDGTPNYNGEATVDYFGSYSPNIEAKVTLTLGAGSIEYVMPVFQDLEISAGALMGLGRLNLSIEQNSGNPSWEKLFDFAYGSKAWVLNEDGSDSTLTYYYAVANIDDDEPGFYAANAPGVMSDISGTFFNFQPYVAIKWQLLDRVGLRISAGFNKGTIGQGRWKLNSRNLIADSEAYTLQGVSFRTMLYLGL